MKLDRRHRWATYDPRAVHVDSEGNTVVGGVVILPSQLPVTFVGFAFCLVKGCGKCVVHEVQTVERSPS